MNINRFPDEILLRTFDHFDTKTLARSSQVCKRWKLVSQDQSLWENLYKEEYGKDLQSEKLNYKNLCRRKYELLDKIKHDKHKKYETSITLGSGLLGLNGRLLILGKIVFFTKLGKIFYSKVKKSNYKNSILMFIPKFKKIKISYQSLSGQTKQMYPNRNSISLMDFHPNGYILEKCSQHTFLSREFLQRNRESSFAVWNVNTGSCVFAERRSIDGLIQIIKDRVIYNNRDKGMICCDMETKKVMFSLPGLSSLVSHQTSNDNFVAAACVDNTIHVYDLKKKKKIPTLENVKVRVLSLTEDKLIYQTRTEIYIYDLKTLTLICQIPIPSSYSRSFCHNQKIIIHVSENYPNILMIRDLRGECKIQKLRGLSGLISNFKMTDNRVVAISSTNKVVWIWDINSAQLKTTLRVSPRLYIKNFQIENNLLHLSIFNSNESYSQFWNLTNCQLISEEKFKKNKDSKMVWCHYEDGILTYLYKYPKCFKSAPICCCDVEMFKYLNLENAVENDL